jgi:vacuolar-type H+-ATPase subunit I/STV1
METKKIDAVKEILSSVSQKIQSVPSEEGKNFSVELQKEIEKLTKSEKKENTTQKTENREKVITEDIMQFINGLSLKSNIILEIEENE